MESDTEEEEILEERDAVPLRIRIPGARDRGGPLAAAIPAPIDPEMWLNIVNVKPPHLADLEVESRMYAQSYDLLFFMVSTIVNWVHKINCYDFKTVSPHKS